MIRTFFKAAAASLFLTAPALAEDAPALDTVIMTVNGEEVTLGEAILLRQALPAQYQNAPDQALFDVIAQQLRNQTLLAQRAVTDGVTEDAVVVLRKRFDERAMLGEILLRRAVDAAVTEAAIQAAYDAQYANVEGPAEVRASHILRKDKAEVEDLKAQLDAGADFAELAKEWGTDGTKDNGGDLGWFVKEAMVAPFAEAAFAMEEGQVSDPVETRFGWHLIYLTGKRTQPVPTLEEVQPQIAQDLSAEAARAYLDGLNADAQVVDAATEINPAWIRLDDLVQP